MPKLRFEYIIQHYYKIFFTAVIFIVYIFTLAPSVQQIDSGELAAVQCTLGIAHPTGYPMFTFIGYLFQLIPLPFSSILKLNLLSAIWSTISIYFFFSTMELIYEKIYVNLYLRSSIKKKSRFRKAQSAVAGILDQQYLEIFAVTGSGFILAFSRTFWLQSTGVEVYSLHMALISIVIYFLIRIFFKTKVNIEKATENWMIVAMLLALGFSNHMTTVLILPAAAILFYHKERLNLTSLRMIGASVMVFIIVLIFFYSYLPTRALMYPEINWGNPVSIENMIRHISGQQYQVWLFSSFESAEQNLINFYKTLQSEFLIIIFLFILLGFVELLIRSKILFLFVFVCFLTTVLYSINYDINDIDSYFLLAYYSLAIISFFGIIVIFKFLRYLSLPRRYALLVLGIAIISHGVWNFSKADQSDVYIFEDYTKNILSSVEENSIILSYQWDYFVSASYYFQFVEKYRDDVIVIDKELLRRSWYYKQLKTNNPELFTGLNSDVNNFLSALRPFENGEIYDSELLENKFRIVLTSLIASNIDEHDFYIGPEMFDNELKNGQLILPKGYNIVPHLFLFKVVKGKKYVPAPDPVYTLRIPGNQSRYSKMITTISGQMLAYRALYELDYKKTERARVYLNKITSDFPDYNLPDRLKNILNN